MFFAFALVILPIVDLLGLATVRRLNQSRDDWFRAGQGMNRIRRDLVEVASEAEPYLIMPTSDEQGMMSTTAEDGGNPPASKRNRASDAMKEAGGQSSLISNGERSIKVSTKAKSLIPRTLLVFAGFALLLVSLPPAFAGSGITAKALVTANFPGSLVVAPDGRIFYGETYTGRIYVYNPVTTAKKLFFSVPGIGGTIAGSALDAAPVHGSDQGLYGLALHPNYPSTPYVYATAARVFADDVHKNQVLRLTDSGGTGTGLKVLTSQVAGVEHFGGRLLFGPDGMLYVVVGEGGNAANAQDLTSNNFGKVLRMMAGGGIPADNPFPNSRTFAYGIRNSIGMDFDPTSSRLWLMDNGPSCNDEVNIILKGKNYGWGPLSAAPDACGTPPEIEATNRDGSSPELPRAVYNPSIGPTGAAFCSNCNLGPDSAGRFFFSDWNTGQIRRLTLNSTRWDVESQDVVYDHFRGILAVEEARGAIYFSDEAAIYTLGSEDSTGGATGGTKTVSVYNYYFSPKTPLVPQGYGVKWTFKQGTHTATDASGMGYFNSGLKSVGQSYSHTFTAAGRYKYRSTASGDPKTMVGIIKVPLKVSPLSGGTSTTFNVTWASAAPASSHFSDAAYRFKPCGKSQGCGWQTWKNWRTNQTSATSASFSPTNGKGTYQFRARFGKQVTSSTKKFSLWSVPVTVSVA